MSHNARTAVNAIAAALTRVVADGFMLRFQAESLLWNLDQADRLRAAVLQQSHNVLHELISSAALRIQALGGRSPQSLDQLETLSSLVHSEAPVQTAYARLAEDFAALRRGCRMVALIARSDGDLITEQLLRAKLGLLEGILQQLRPLAQLE